MINRLIPGFAAPTPKPRTHGKAATNEDFAALLNQADHAGDAVQATPGNAPRTGRKISDEKNGDGPFLRDEHEIAAAQIVQAAPFVSANGLEARALATSQPALATPAPLSPTTGISQAPTPAPALAPSITPATLTTSTPSTTPAARALPDVSITQTPRATPSPPVAGVPAPPVETHALATPPEVVRVVANATAENVELVSLPWHLQANAGLSYRSVGVTLQDIPVDQMGHAGEAPRANPSARAAALAAMTEDSIVEQQIAFVRSGAAIFVSDRVQRSAAMTAAADIVLPGRSAAASLLWPHRLLRWLADSDAGMTAWVRDYRLDPSQAAQLVDSLRCLADQQGHSLHRIMLNGHELWRAASTPVSH